MIIDQKSATASPLTVAAVSEESRQRLQQQMHQFIGPELASVEAEIQELVESRYPEVSRLTKRAASMGGKRLRPVLAILSAFACCDKMSPRKRKDLIRVGAAVELVHAASLVHDDVMDHAEERRHQATVFSISSNSQAILTGDFLFTRAYQVAANCRSTFAAKMLAKAATQLCEGELRQQACIGNWNLPTKDYLDLLRQKTGVLCGASCFLGAWAAGGTREQAKALGQFGTKLGVAFQIFDDWLDYWGTEEVGKTLGTDFAQEKPTLPTLRLLQIQGDSTAARQRIVEALRNNKSNAHGIRQLLDDTDASQYTLRCARGRIEAALSLVDSLQESTAKGLLQQIARFSVMRTA